MQKWCQIKLYKQGKEYQFDLPLGDAAIILIDTWKSIILEDHKVKINTLIDKFRELKLPVFHANYGNESGIDIHPWDIDLKDYATLKNFPKYLFYAGYEIDKCLIGRTIGIPFATYENKTPILIKDLTDCINKYDDISEDVMKVAAIHIIEHCYGFTTTFQDLLHALSHTTTTTIKRNIIEPVNVLIK